MSGSEQSPPENSEQNDPSRQRAFDLAIFDQGTWWRTPEGDSIAIDRISPKERVELASWLLAHHRHFYLAVLRRDLVRAALIAARATDVRGEAGAAAEFGVKKVRIPLPAQLRELLTGQLGAHNASVASGQPRSLSAAQVGPLVDGPVPEIVYLSSEQWLESTRLYRALRR